MRGKGLPDGLTIWCTRITPAHAGKSELGDGCTLGSRDHPRPCGEKLVIRPDDGTAWGSPPPMRGKENWTTEISEGSRITPAHAGKS